MDLFQPVCLLGAGGYGAVWRARQRSLEREVALKVVHSTHHDPTWRQRFEREARLTSGLLHPSIVRVLDFDPAGDHPYIAYELVEGGTLEERLQLAPRPPLGDCLRWMGGIAEALALAHGAGVLHRDVKPANILLRPDGSAALADFGLARADQGGEVLTRTGVMVGTPLYLAPECWHGAPATAASEQFSLAAVLYRAVLGRPLFELGTVLESLLQLETEGLRIPQDVDLPRPLAWLLTRALAHDPTERFASMAQLSRELAKAALPEPAATATATAARPRLSPRASTPASPPEAPPRRSRAPLAAAAAALALLVAKVGGGTGWHRAPPPAPAPDPGPAAAAAAPPDELRTTLEALATAHRLPDGSMPRALRGGSYQDHLAEAVEEALEPRFTMRLRRLLAGLGERYRQGAADARLEREVLPFIRHLEIDLSMLERFARGASVPGMGYPALRDRLGADADVRVGERLKEVGETLREVLPTAADCPAPLLEIFGRLEGSERREGAASLSGRALELLERGAPGMDPVAMAWVALNALPSWAEGTASECTRNFGILDRARAAAMGDGGDPVEAQVLACRVAWRWLLLERRCPDQGPPSGARFEDLVARVEGGASRAPAATLPYLTWMLERDAQSIFSSQASKHPEALAALARLARRLAEGRADTPAPSSQDG